MGNRIASAATVDTTRTLHRCARCVAGLLDVADARLGFLVLM
jgi:hypothetical protein